MNMQIGVSYLGTLVINSQSYINGRMMKVDKDQIVAVDELTDIVSAPTPLSEIALGSVVEHQNDHFVVVGVDGDTFEGLSFTDNVVKKFALTSTPGFPTLITRITYAGADLTIPQIIQLGGYMKGEIGKGVALALGKRIVKRILRG